MTNTYHANPYDPSATGFYFETSAEFDTKRASLQKSYGDPVEEFEIQFIDGDPIDAELFQALNPHQGNIGQFMSLADNVDFYHFDTLTQLAEYYVAEGLFGNIPEHLVPYIDYEAIGRDLGFDGYSETTINGYNIIYRSN